MLLSLLRRLAAILALATLAPSLVGDTAEALYRKGVRAQRQGRHVEAYLLYSRARALKPAEPKYARAFRGVRRGAAQLLAAAGEYRTALELAPDSWEFARLVGEPREPAPVPQVTIRAEPRYKEPVRLRFAGHSAGFRFRSSLREAYEEVAVEFGVRVLFDDEFDGDHRIRADLDECGLRCALRALGDLGRSAAVAVDTDQILVIPDTPQKRSQLEPTVFATVPLDSGLAPETVAEVVQVVQQILDLKQFQASGPGGVLLVRDSVAKAALAQTLAENLLHLPASAQIEVQLISVSNGSLVRAGIVPPTRFPVTNLSTLLGAVPSPSAGAERLIGLGGGETVLGVAVGDASFTAALDASAAQSLYRLQVRSAHGLPAEVRIGERYPVATAQYSPGTRGPTGPGFVQPPPSVTFEDLGLNLAVTPLIHSAREITLQLAAQFRFLSGGAVNGVPVLSNREFESQVRLRQGEFAIVSGIAVYERSQSASGLFGLGRVPWLGALFRTGQWRWSRSDLLILVRPRISQLPPAELARMPTVLTGTEQRPFPPL